ncbi:hypothetical protein B566_EDAN002940 [Ephemera danica]|nr:hypothetical protein B566_EDAN002940 [Ephemera danica]
MFDNGATQDLFDLVVRAQRNRLDDQRCELPRPSPPAAVCTPPPSPQSDVEEPAPTTRMLLEEVLLGPEPLPMFLLPPGGGYWAEGGDPVTADNSCSWQPVPTPELETDEAATSYRRHFMGREHFTLMLEDANLGPVILSVRHVEGGATRLLVRLRSGTKQLLLPNAPPSDCSPAQLVKNERFTPVVCARAAELLATYDEHALSSAFKFGVVPQKRGQTTEEQLFSNRDPSPALLAFLDLLGNRVRLRDHKGYRGGLDTQFGHTGEEAVYRVFRGCEVMFHVAPLLPFAEHDPQQLQRKRHVGNDIVAIIFQEENTPFAPDMIASHFLHVYRVAVTAREGVPKFGPPLPNSSIFKPGPELQDWLLVKLINAETAAYRANTFAALRSRTRKALLGNLAQDLRCETRRFLGDDTNVIATSTSAPSTPPATSAVTSGSRFIDTVRKALSAKPKPVTSKIAETPLTPTQKEPPSLTTNGVQGDSTASEETDAELRERNGHLQTELTITAAELSLLREASNS